MFRPIVALFLLLFAGVFVFGWHVGERGLWSAHEGRAAQNAQNILDTGNWLIPTLYSGDPDLQKPPAYYWLVALCGAIDGKEVSPLLVRLPATICALIGLALVVFLGRALWNWEAGILAGIVMLTTTRYAWLARVGRIDMVLCLILLACLWLFWRTESKRDGGKLSWLFYVLLGAATLLKGPVADVLVLLPIAVYLAMTSHPVFPFVQAGWSETWRRLRLVPGLCVVLIVAAPWYAYAVWYTDGAYFREFFVYHNVIRALGTNEGLKTGPFWFYLPRLVGDTFPWSLLFPALATALWQEWRRTEPGRIVNWRPYTFLLAWLGSHFVFLSLVQFKRGDYLLPALPAVALLLTGWLHDRTQRFEHRMTTRPVRNLRRRANVILFSAFLLATVVAPLLVWALIEFRKKGVVHSILKVDLFDQYLNGTDEFMLGHIERLLRQNWMILGVGLVVITASVWVMQTAWHQRRNRPLVASFAAPWLVAFLFYLHVLLPAIDPFRESSRFANVIRTVATEERTIYYFEKFDADLVFHAGKPAAVLLDWNDVLRLGESPESQFIVMKASQAEHLPRGAKSADWLVVADNRETAFGEHRDPRVLVTNRPHAVAGEPAAGDTIPK